MMSVRSLSALCSFTICGDTEDVRDDVSSFGRLTFRLHLHRDLNVRKTLRIGIVLWILSETLQKRKTRCQQVSCTGREGDKKSTDLEDDIVVERDLFSSDALSEIREIVVDEFDDDLRRLVALEEIVEYFSVGTDASARLDPVTNRGEKGGLTSRRSSRAGSTLDASYRDP